MTERTEVLALRILDARDGDEEARDTIIEDAIELAGRVLAFSTGQPGTIADYVEGVRARKPHVLVDQAYYERVARATYTGCTVEEATLALNVSEATARRQLDGLASQKRLIIDDPGGPGRHALRVRYRAPRDHP